MDNMKKTNKYNILFAGMQFFLWSGLCVYYVFFVPYLKSNGFNEVKIGILMSIISVVGLIGPIMWGIISDRFGSVKAILIFNLLAGCLIVQFVPLVIGNFGLLAAVLIIVNMTACSQTTILDGWIMRMKSQGAPINYGLIRAGGSLAYAATSVISGFILTQLGLGALFPMFLIIECVMVLLVILMRQKPAQQQIITIHADQADERNAPLFKNRDYIIFVIISTVLFTGLSGISTFFPLLMQSVGGTNADIGLAIGVMSFSEAPFMFLSNRLLTRFKDTSLLTAAMCFFTLRIFLFFSIHSVIGLILAQATNSITVGIFLPTSVHYISRITPGKTKTTALSLAISVYVSGGGILGNFFGGIIIDKYGLRSLFGTSTVVAAVAAAAFGISLLLARRKRRNDAVIC